MWVPATHTREGFSRLMVSLNTTLLPSTHDRSAAQEPWRHYRVQPWRSETFKFSTDPELVAKVTDVVGLYLAPPENAIVLCVDEKSQIQALDRTQKMLPMQPGFPERRTHEPAQCAGDGDGEHQVDGDRGQADPQRVETGAER